MHYRWPVGLWLCLTVTVTVAAEHTAESLTIVKQEVDAGRALLVDVREQSEWNAGHVQGAISLPISQINDGLSAEELGRLPQDKVLYTYCVLGKRALTAGQVLEQQGLRVKVLKPGYKELIAAGFPPTQD